MRHKYLPRFGAVVLGLGGAAAAGVGLGCSDSTGPGGASGTTSYAVTVLADQGYGGNAAFVGTGNEVVGYVTTAAGGRRPAVWRDGTLSIPPAPGGDAAAVRIDAAGDLLIQRYDFRHGGPLEDGVRVVRADGTVFGVGADPPYEYPVLDEPCCRVAGDLTDQRVALGTGLVFNGGRTSLRVDVAANRALDSLPARYSRTNSAGQLVGSYQPPGAPTTTRANTLGFTLPARPAGDEPFTNRAGSPTYDAYSIAVVDLDDQANVLAEFDRNQNFAYLSASAPGSVWLDRYVGRVTAARLSRQGGLVATLDSAGTVSVWNAATGGVSRVRLADAAWRVDSLGGVNANGAIAAHGVSASTGRTAALLLTPAR